MLKNFINFVLKRETSFSRSLERGIGLGLLALPIIQVNGSFDIPSGNCSGLTCPHFWELQSQQTFAGLFNQIKKALYNYEDILGLPHFEGDESSVLAFFDTFESTGSDQGKTIEQYHPYFCAVSEDWTRALTFYKPQNAKSPDERHRLLLTLQDHTIQGIRDEDVEQDNLHGELIGAKLFPVQLPLMSVIGTPECSFSLSETGTKVQVKTIFEELSAIVKSLEDLSTTSLSKLQDDIRTDTEKALKTATDPLSTSLSAISESLANLTKEADGVLPKLENQVKNAIKEDGDLVRTELGNLQTALTSAVEKNVKESTDATKKNVDDAVSDLKSTVNTDIESAQNAIIQHLDKQLENWQGNLDGTKKEQNNTLVSGVLKTVQTGYKKIAAQSEINHQKTKDELTSRIQAITGVTLDVHGQPQGGSLLQHQQRVLEDLKAYTLQSPELHETIDKLTQIFGQYGMLPDYYIESVRTMLYGCTQFSSKILPGNSILHFLNEFPDLLSDVNLKKYVEQFSAPIKNIRILSRYMEVTNPSNLRTAMPIFMRLFGPKTPVFDISGSNVYKYCESAHFSAEDFGLYAWVKDIYTLLKDFKKASEDFAVVRASASQDPILSQTLAFQEKAIQVVCSCGPACSCGGGSSGGDGTVDGVQTDLDLEFLNKTIIPTLSRLEELLEGKVNKQQVIPVWQFDGLCTYPEILQVCVDKIKNLRKYSEYAQMERKFELLSKECRDRSIALEQIVGRLSTVVENALWFYQPCSHHHPHHGSCPEDETHTD